MKALASYLINMFGAGVSGGGYQRALRGGPARGVVLSTEGFSAAREEGGECLVIFIHLWLKQVLVS